MKFVLIGIFLLLIGLSVVAWMIRPDTSSHGKTVLTWVSDDNPGRRQQIATFNALHPDIEVRLDPANAGMQKVIVQSLGGVGPDLFDCYSPYELSSYVQAGIAWDVTDVYKQRGIDMDATNWPGALAYAKYEGRYYGHPTNACVNAVFFNKDTLDKCGVPYPSGTLTWDQFLALAKRLTVRDKSGRITQFGFSFDTWMWRDYLFGWGGRVYAKDGTRCTINSPQAVAAVKFMHDLIYVHHVMPTPTEEAALASEGGWGTSNMRWLGDGRLAMAQVGRWWLCTLRNTEKLRLGAIPIPLGPSGKYWGYGRATLVNRNSPRRDAALQFLLYEDGKDYNNLVNQQADGLAPVEKYCTPEVMTNPKFPWEDYHEVFRQVMPLGESEKTSPFVNDAAVNRILDIQLDLVRRDVKTPEAAMNEAAKQIDALIQQTVADDPKLRARYEAAGKGGTRP